MLVVNVFLYFFFTVCGPVESVRKMPNLSLRYLSLREIFQTDDKSSSSSSKEFEGRIVGGEDTNILDTPYQVSVQHNGIHFCGGAIITAKHVITAAHCTQGKNASDLRIRAGSTYRDTDGMVIKVKTTVPHPKYDIRTVDYDVSILVLKNILPYSEFIQPIALAKEGDTWANNTASLTSGWGLTDEDDDDDMAPRHLRSVVLHVIDMTSCEQTYGTLMIQVSERMLCVGFPDGSKDTCKGDSGGPLVIDGILAGVVSFGFGCARPGLPGIYTSVPAVRDFIDYVILEHVKTHIVKIKNSFNGHNTTDL